MTDSLRSFPTASRLELHLEVHHLIWHCELLIEQWFLPKNKCVCVVNGAFSSNGTFAC